MDTLNFNLEQGLNKPKSKKKYLYSALILLLILLSTLGGYLYYTVSNKLPESSAGKLDVNNFKQAVATSTPLPTPVYVQNPITGVMMEERTYKEIQTRPILNVIIQNNIASRPQFGLNQADIVYETLAEGGITRFMGVFWTQDAPKIMSVRSARKYFVDLTGEYNKPVFMHIGYSDGEENISAYKAINKYGVRTLGFQGDSYLRDPICEQKKAIEHCAYTDTQTLWSLAQKKGWTGDISKFTPWKFKSPSDLISSDAKDLTDFTVNFSSLYPGDYSVKWKFDPVTKKYSRFNINNTAFSDGEGKQVTSDVIIYQKINSILTGDSKGHLQQDVIGSGTGSIMQDGKVYPVKWQKTSYTARTKYFDLTSGEEFKLKPGKIWVTLVPSGMNYVDNAPTPTPTKVTDVPKASPVTDKNKVIL